MCNFSQQKYTVVELFCYYGKCNTKEKHIYVVKGVKDDQLDLSFII